MMVATVFGVYGACLIERSHKVIVTLKNAKGVDITYYTFPKSHIVQVMKNGQGFEVLAPGQDSLGDGYVRVFAVYWLGGSDIQMTKVVVNS